MTDRKLTDEERRLWQLYTRNVKAIAHEKVPRNVKSNASSYKIKVPRKLKLHQERELKLSNHESLRNKDSNWGKRLQQGKAKIEGKLDLHGMTCAEAHQKLYDYLSRAQSNGKRAVLIVTGKGGIKQDLEQTRYSEFENNHGILKREVPMWLSSGAMRHMVVSFQDARRQDGGTGALYVVIKRIK